MLSRVAESIYWMNRYIERAENTARFIEVNIRLVLDMPFAMVGQWDSLITSSGNSQLFFEKHGQATEDNVIRFLTFDRTYSSSILACLSAARESARTVREIISSEMWEQLNQFYLNLKDTTLDTISIDERCSFFNKIKSESHLLSGITDAAMYHGEAWHFGWLGRLIERADQTSRILYAKHHMVLPEQELLTDPYDRYQWLSVLRSVSGLEAYRKVRRRRIVPLDVTDFLILDRHFPRSMHHCVMKAEETLHAITGSHTGTFYNKAEKLLGQLRSELDFIEIDDIMNKGLDSFLDTFQKKLSAVDNAIYDTYFSLTPVGK